MFDEGRYFDVFAEYAKAGPDDTCIRLTIWNRGPDAAELARAPDGLVPQHLDVGLHLRGELLGKAAPAGARGESHYRFASHARRFQLRDRYARAVAFHGKRNE